MLSLRGPPVAVTVRQPHPAEPASSESFYPTDTKPGQRTDKTSVNKSGFRGVSVTIGRRNASCDAKMRAPGVWQEPVYFLEIPPRSLLPKMPWRFILSASGLSEAHSADS